ncbi:MAG: RecQ family ATP-dependent DNA helicase [Tannerellaceae bacterium]|nr:RecQ family ATP-dependent DNA helicase [Tannerellaceae bacterium]
MDVYHKILSDYWGYSAFRPLQEDIIRSVAAGNDTLGLMPTGGGKSITFQVPALAAEGICIVITPLISLMKDQVDNLRHKGIKAAAVYSGMDKSEIIARLENCIFGNYKFLYVSPERISSDLFRAKLSAMNVSLVAVDESHCISQWGYDFRPSYLAIADIRSLLPGVPVLALTATATPPTVADIQERLRFKAPNVFSVSFRRGNLAYVVRRADDKQPAILHILRRVAGSAIVYVRSRQRTVEIAAELRAEGITAEYYHAGVNPEEKNIRQNKWKKGECRVMVATNAFGMGIDKPDVRLVIHVDMPGSLEEYFQEAGRAGRDGRKAYAVVICGPSDVRALKKRLSDEFPDKAFIGKVYDALGSFFQVASGFGYESVHEFSLERFCRTYRFALLPAHHALKILELSGYIEYQEESENASRLTFIAGRDELYDIRHGDPRADGILQAILRIYTGLFSDYAFISESLVASRSGCKPVDVYQTLVALSKRRIVNYIPKRKTPRIVYARSREEPGRVIIPSSAWEERRSRFEQRLAKAIEYISTDNRCRSRILLEYFGEKQPDPCGCCDVCLANKHSSSARVDLNGVRSAVVDLVSSHPQPVSEVAATLSASLAVSPEQIIAAVRHLVDSDERFVLNDGSLKFNATA